MKFRKKPVIVEAEQWWSPDWEGHYNYDKPDRLGIQFRHFDSQPVIQTLEGPHLITSGDWIITGVKGEKYPCKPEIFALTYESVEDTKGGG